jgi:hypothetical protein
MKPRRKCQGQRRSVLDGQPVGQSDEREHPLELLGRAAQDERPPACLGGLLGPDQHAHAGAVDERKAVEIEHHTIVWLRQHLGEVLLQLGCRHDVQLARENEHNAPVIIPAVDRKLGRDSRILIASHRRPSRFTTASRPV